jgi:hypothetical protein
MHTKSSDNLLFAKAKIAVPPETSLSYPAVLSAATNNGFYIMIRQRMASPGLLHMWNKGN